MSEIQAIVNVILFEDGNIEVICDTALDDRVCLQILQHAAAVTAQGQIQPESQPKSKSESLTNNSVIDFTKRKR